MDAMRRPRRPNDALAAGVLGLSGVALFWAPACGSLDESDLRRPDASVPAADGGEGLSTLTVTAPGAEEYADRTGPWRVEISALGQPRARAVLLPGSGGLLQAEVGGLPAGRYEVVVWLDADGNAVLNGCPFPPKLGDAARADTFENLVGRATVVLDGLGPAAAAVPVDRRTCGPGDPATGLSLALRLGAGVEGPLLLHLEPSTRCAGAAAGGELPRLTVALPPVLPGRRRTLSLGELLPGCFDLSFFADADADGLPTPCGGVPAGGDRAVLSVPGFRIAASTRRALDADVNLGVSTRCPAVAQGLTGTVSLGDALQAAAAAGELGAEIWGAPARIALTHLPSGTFQDAALPFAQLPPAGGRTFTVTGLAPGPYDVAIYLDGDADRAFSPCGGLNGGVDAIFEQRFSVDVGEDALTQLGEVRLQRSPACAEAGTELRLRPLIDVEDGPVGSGRPVRLELLPIDGQGERRSLLLFENHRALDDRPLGADGAWHMAVQVKPGTYQARIFVDTDRDGVFTSCAVDPFADRATSEPVALTIGADRLDFRDVAVTSLGCDVPDAAIGPTFSLAAEVPPVEGAFLRFEIAEAGGWREVYPLRTPVGSEALPFTPAPIKLAPGAYELRAWLDAAADGLFDGCDGLRPEALAGHVAFSLDAANPTARPELALEPACGSP